MNIADILYFEVLAEKQQLYPWKFVNKYLASNRLEDIMEISENGPEKVSKPFSEVLRGT